MTARRPVLPVLPVLVGLFAEGGIRRGSVVAVEGGAGSTSLLLALLAGAGGEGAWAAAVGVPLLGLEAAAAAGVVLERLLVIPRPGGAWPEVAAAMLDSVDMVVLGAPRRCREVDGRRLTARARERRAVLLLEAPQSIGGPKGGPETAPSWPGGVDLRLRVERSVWEGTDRGFGRLQGRRAVVRAWGRGTATRERRMDLMLPGPDGSVEAVLTPVAGDMTPLRSHVDLDACATQETMAG